MQDIGSKFNLIEGNYIGTDITGTVAVGNLGAGIAIFNGAQSNQIGGITPAERNIVSGNSNDGIGVSGAGTDTNLIEGNYIGTDVSGLFPLGNAFNGISIFGTAQSNTVSTNVASGNLFSGISLDSACPKSFFKKV